MIGQKFAQVKIALINWKFSQRNFRWKMMSGIELNELMTKVSNGSNAISNFEPVQKPYNRELWRIDNGILEEDLVNFVLDKSKKKIDQLG